MDTTFEPSFLQNVQRRIAALEAIELSILGFVAGVYGAYNAITLSGESLFDQISFFIGLQVFVLGSWLIYNGYIRIARAGGRLVDVGLWIVASLVTASYTFWAWSLFDINRFIVSKLFYRGEAPLEYAWSARSKQIRKGWEQARKAGYR